MERMTQLIVGYDGSPWSLLAVRRALSSCESSSFSLVHVIQVVETLEDGRVVLPDGAICERLTALESLRLTVQKYAEQWELERPSVRVMAHLKSGPVARTLIDSAYRYRATGLYLGAHSRAPHCNRVGETTQEVLQWTSDLPVYVESLPLLNKVDSPFDALEWTYVFGPLPLGRSSAPRSISPLLS